MFCDLFKAFDYVNHETLNPKLRFYGIESRALGSLSRIALCARQVDVDSARDIVYVRGPRGRTAGIGPRQGDFCFGRNMGHLYCSVKDAARARRSGTLPDCQTFQIRRNRARELRHHYEKF
ncbi:hypothetical protein EVAR_68970_1 [Eumeta japonica]|uniref:Uncharacterized protein n=1 Tax=Eumeta variegata TaxID=151549 RepID=A0A4C2A340_EUMVA|nr:hypothetical protein EVAR_68970_1 [Eumeta japonica]